MYRTFVMIAALPALVQAICAAQPSDSPKIALPYSTARFQKLKENAGDDLELYRKALEANGAIVVDIPQPNDINQLPAMLDGIDGILLPGGIDVDPKFYDEERRPKLEKTDESLDEFEFGMLEYALKHDVPVLAICRGIQVVNVHFGGSLYQDIPSQCKNPHPVTHRYPKDSKEVPEHPIRIAKDSVMYELFGAERFVVNTHHHQAIKALAPGFRATAWSDDGLIEAIEHVGKPFILGLQCHPEKVRDRDPRFNDPFKRLIQEALAVRK